MGYNSTRREDRCAPSVGGRWPSSDARVWGEGPRLFDRRWLSNEGPAGVIRRQRSFARRLWAGSSGIRRGGGQACDKIAANHRIMRPQVQSTRARAESIARLARIAWPLWV